MRRISPIVVLVVLILAFSAETCFAAKQPSGPVKHYVTLMMENRAYDHLLGYFQIPGIHLTGLSGSEYNLWDINDPLSKPIYVSKDAKDRSPDPDHSVRGTSTCIFGTETPSQSAKERMNGFVKRARHTWGDAAAPIIMQSFDPVKIPIITTLAKNYAFFDQWHASVPGPTYGNRMYFHAGTSHGVCTNVVPNDGFHIKTLYQLLDESGYDWAFYFDQSLDASFFNYTRQPKFASRLRPMSHFKKDADAGTLPTMSFLLPHFFSMPGVHGDDQHPSHSVAIGEGLIKKVYEELRQSASWNASAFLLTYDEHGGFYDHVHPPEGVPNPDGLDCSHPVAFNYTRLGLRVPTILISPWVEAVAVHQPKGYLPQPNSKFEHSSFIATLARQLGIAIPTKRVAWAAPFDYLFTRSTPRMDCPYTLPSVHQPSLDEYLALDAQEPEYLQPINELQISYIQALNGHVGRPADAGLDQIKTEHDGALYVMQTMQEWQHKAKNVVQV